MRIHPFYKLGIFVISILIGPFAFAEFPNCGALDGHLNQTLTLQDLMDASLSCNPNTQVAWAQMKINEANIGIAEKNYWPQITGQVNAAMTEHGGNFFSFSNTNNSSTSSGTVTNFSQSGQFSYTPTLSLSYLLVDFGNTRNNVKAAHLQWLASKFSKDYTGQQTILLVEQSYYQLLATQALLAATQSNLKQAKDSLDAATLMHKVGTETIGDVYQAQSAYAQALLSFKQTQGNYEIAKGQLNNAIGIPVNTELKLSTLPDIVKTNQALQSADYLLNYAEQNRPDLISARKQVEANEASLAAVKAQAWPTLSINATAGSTYPTHVENGGLSRNVSLVLNVPLFTGFQQHYSEQKAEASVEESEAEQDKLANQIEFQVWQAYYNLKTATQTLQTNEELLKSSTQAAKQTSGQYKAGVGNILSVLTTQSTLANARAQEIQAKLDWYIAVVQLDAALGTLAE